MPDHVNQQLGNYRLIRSLGRGGFAEVYLGEHIYLNTQAAIKVLSTHLTEADSEHFQREAQTVASLRHPHIVRVLDFDVEAGIPFLAMDYARNGTLRQRHPKGVQLPLDSVLAYVKQAASALQHAHDHGVIHRDVKPENMLLGSNNEVLLTDFGIALLAQSSHPQNSQQIAGTARYMAPEQLQGEPCFASDQYALAVVVYEWLSGDLPFRGTFSEIAAQHLFVPPKHLCKKVSTISPDVEWVVLTALEKPPHKRFSSMQAFANALEQACQASPSGLIISSAEITPPIQSLPLTHTIAVMTATQSSSPTKAVPPPDQQPQIPNPYMQQQPVSLGLSSKKRSNRRTVLVSLAGIATVTGGIGIVAWLESLGNNAKKLTPAPEKPPGTTLEIYRRHTNIVASVSWSPNGSKVASGSWDTTVQVWDASTGNRLIDYTGHADVIHSVAWSPDGSKIASGSGINPSESLHGEYTVQVWQAENGDHIYTYRRHSGPVYAVSWSPDGRYIASGDNGKVVHVWDNTNGNQEYIYSGHTNSVSAVSWSPDGRYIASGSWDKTVQVWDPKARKLIYTYPHHTDSIGSVAWSPDGRYIASGSNDKTVQVWEATTGKRIREYSVSSSPYFEPIGSVAWSPDGKYIASGYGDYSVHVWDFQTNKHIIDYPEHSDWITSIAWSPHEKKIVSGSWDKTIRIWEV